jgi:hypothetical protein
MIHVSLSKLIQAVGVVRLLSGFAVCMLGFLVAHHFPSSSSLSFASFGYDHVVIPGF